MKIFSSHFSPSPGNILGDTALVENLETTKRTAAEIEQRVGEAKITSAKIDQAREYYRPAAARASLIYFILNDLNTINPIYQFSLKVRTKQSATSRVKQSYFETNNLVLLIDFQAFSVVFQKAIERADKSEDVSIRVHNLIDSITYSVFMYTTRGLFECDKLIFTSQMAFQVGGSTTPKLITRL